MTELQSALDNAVLDALRESVGDDPEFLAELIDTFVADAPGQLESLRGSAASGDTAGARRAAHTLKGNGLTFGARELASLCQRPSRRLERAISRLCSLRWTGSIRSGVACRRSYSPSATVDDDGRGFFPGARRGAPEAGRARVPRREQPGGGDRHGLRRAGDGLEPGRRNALRLFRRRGARPPDRRPRDQRRGSRRGTRGHTGGDRNRPRPADHAPQAEGRHGCRRRADARSAQRRRRARGLPRHLPRPHRGPAGTGARRDAPDRDPGAGQDAEPRGHHRDDHRRVAASRALRQLLRPGDPGKPPA